MNMITMTETSQNHQPYQCDNGRFPQQRSQAAANTNTCRQPKGSNPNSDCCLFIYVSNEIEEGFNYPLNKETAYE